MMFFYINYIGMLTVRKIENIPTVANSKPRMAVSITECGEL